MKSIKIKHIKIANLSVELKDASLLNSRQDFMLKKIEQSRQQEREILQNLA